MNQRMEKSDGPDGGLGDYDNDLAGGSVDEFPPGDGGPSAAGVGDTLLDESDPLQVSTYILDMTMALRNVASKAGMDFLAYLLDMAAEESLEFSRRVQEAKISPTQTVRKAG